MRIEAEKLKDLKDKLELTWKTGLVEIDMEDGLKN